MTVAANKRDVQWWLAEETAPHVKMLTAVRTIRADQQSEKLNDLLSYLKTL